MDASMYASATEDTYYEFDTWTEGSKSTGLTKSAFHTIIAYGDDSTTFTRKMYTVALSFVDQAVQGIHDALDAVGQLDNSIIIVTSDNGGCYQAGGMNGDLRGTKGSLFEGNGVRSVSCGDTQNNNFLLYRRN